ncbi:MAG TPA: penicillin-binding protein 2 [Candidatus Moranbacteria bacterium]|nr:MAG: Peptidoglycan glycosyltransferase [Candidatus Moranbacteria bacterium GW2011_GWC2_45_10]KKT95028.1 MAG: penicillin-binding protein 2, penicillin-binding protein 2 [Parcubacteria group bacterium GW2011_GWC1_45_14]HAV11521.1 penicillin-binding protein 2 [Candidatus Moranbacteria bacterium]
MGNRGMEIEDYVLTATEKESAHMERPLEKKWFDIFWYVLVFFVSVLAARATYLTIIKGSYYQEVSKGNSIRSIAIKAPRGRIFDRHGSLLVNNVPSVDIVAVPADIPKEEEALNGLVRKLSGLIDMNEGEILAKISVAGGNSLNPVLVKENISQDHMLLFLEKAEEFPGIRIEKTAVRDYVDSTIFSHVLGYEGKIEKKELEENAGYLRTDYIGKQGVEKTYENHLRGVHGAFQVEVDSMGNVKREVGIINPKPGSDLILSIDAELQKKLYDSLSASIEKSKVDTAAAVALNPKNGEVLALVTLPSYDNNLFSQKISQEQYLGLIENPNKPLFNRAISGEYAPGSTVKPVLAAGALSEGVITPSTIIDGLGGILRIGSFSFRDWKVHGPSDVRTAIAESNDIFFYSIGGGYGNIEGLGMTRMKKYYDMFGFGRYSEIDIPGESDGFIPDEQWKLDKLGEKWYVGNNYHASIGQGYVTATPLQIVNSIAAIANGGTLFQPHVVSQIRKSDKETVNVEPKVLDRTDISSEIMKVVREGMRQTVTGGTAQQLKELPIEVAGKTGTAQFGNEDKTHAWFVSYAPYENPEIAMVVIIEGSSEEHPSSVPVTKEVYDWYFSRNEK